MSKRLDIFISVCVAVVLGTSGFYAGIYYGFQKSEEYVENILDDFKQISLDVAAFKKISDPKTIRSYVTELNKILDDITLLDRLITTGQISSESLDGFFIQHNDKLDDINNRILALNQELTESISKHREIMIGLSEDLDDSIELIDDNKDAVLKEVGRIYDRIDEMYKDLEDVSKTMEKIKNSKLSKYLK